MCTKEHNKTGEQEKKQKMKKKKGTKVWNVVHWHGTLWNDELR